MKKRYTMMIIIVCFFLAPVITKAENWNVPDKGYFSWQKDVDPSVSAAYTRTMATINFGDQLFNFVNYRVTLDNNGKIILRKLSNNGRASDSSPWSLTKTDNIENLNDLADWDWQPAPVVFDGQLYLFVINKSGLISYSAYNAGSDSWSKIKSIGIGGEGSGVGMAAVVVEGKLCLVYGMGTGWGGKYICWTEDFKSWNSTAIGIEKNYWVPSIYDPQYSPRNMYSQISALSTTSFLNGKKKERLMFAYIDQNYHPISVEYYFTDSNTLQMLSKKTISTENEYQSVALAEGSVKGDPSTGKCIQAFLKKNSKDNGYIRYRIQRYQSINGGEWKERENNLLPQTSPKRLWASKDVNITAAVNSVPEGDNFKQSICLVYRGYDDWDYPLNCAWAESDQLILDRNRIVSESLTGPENTQYIGYIEGTPPFYVNDENGLKDLTDPEAVYRNRFLYEPISSIEFSQATSTSSKKEIGFDVGAEVKMHAGCVKAELSYSYGRKWESEVVKTVTHTVSIEAKKETKGRYITLKPKISRCQYMVKDVNHHIIDTTYYFFISDAVIDYEDVELEALNSADPETYTKEKRKEINLDSYPAIHKSSNSWSGDKASTTLTVETAEATTLSHKAKLKVSGEFGHIWDVGFEGSFEYSLTTTTRKETEISCKTILNPPFEVTDLTKLNYDIYWIKPYSGGNNWWLHEGAANQNTWCVTYLVTSLRRKNGTGFSPPQNENDFVANTITAFTADQTKNGITLKWKTSNEVNNYGFSVERRGDCENWESIGFVEGKGSANTSIEYCFLDSKPLAKKADYRLKQMDNTKNSKYSDIIEITADKQLPIEFSLSQNYPNPFNPTTKISYQIADNKSQENADGQAKMTKLVIYDLLGNEVATLVNEVKEPGSYVVEWNASKVVSGVYFYSLQSGNFKTVKKLMLLK